MKFPRHSEIWLRPYLVDRARRWMRRDSPVRHIWLTIADHFEPFWNRADLTTARRRVEAWQQRWPEIAARAKSSHDKTLPRYTWFYPVEQYHPELLDVLAEMTQDGIGDVEVHIHHEGEGGKAFADSIRTFCRQLTEDHGLLRKVNGQTRFGFIHGNWALDNSLEGGRWCGLNDEITLLRDLGCYADFTMPSGASPSQARTINQAYWCTDDPHAPKSYDCGIAVREGSGANGDLLMIPGPLGLRWRGRFIPRMETGELAAYDHVTPYRVQRWFALAPKIGEHLFLKLYTHGAQDSNREFLLRTGLQDLFQIVDEEAERQHARVHYVSAWQMYRAIDAISLGRDPALSLANQREDATLAAAN